MALVVKDRVKETSTTTGTGTLTLAGAAVGFKSFSVIGDGNTTYYTITNSTDWEVGIGTYTASGTTLSRDTILESSNGGAAVNWGAGSKDVFVTYPAERSVYGDGSNIVPASGETLPIAYGGTGQTTANNALNALLPSQSGNNSKLLTTNGTDASWSAALTANSTSPALTLTQTGTGPVLLLEDSTSPDATPTAVDTNGNLIFAGTTRTSGVTNAIEMNTTANNGVAPRIVLTQWSATQSLDAHLMLRHFPSGTIGTYAVNASGDNLGQISWVAYSSIFPSLVSTTVASIRSTAQSASTANLTLYSTAGLTIDSPSGAYTLPSGDGSSSQVLQTDGAGNVSWQTVGGGSSTLTIQNKTSAYTVVAGDLGTIINCTSGTFTVSLDAAATLGSGFNCWVWNTSATSTDAITIDPNGSETIDGRTTLILRRGEGMQIVCDGTNWQTGDKKTMRGYAENMAPSNNIPIATGSNCVAIHSLSTATGNASFAAGYSADATNTSALAVGRDTTASGSAATAIGYLTTASSDYASAIGNNSSSLGSQAVTGSGAMALGGSYASGTDSFAAAVANNTSSYGATGANSVAVGYFAKATGVRALALLYNCSASGNYSVSIGYGSNALNQYSVAFGDTCRAAADDAYAFGKDADSLKAGKFAYSAGQFSGRGDAQTGTFVLRRATTDATATVLTTNNTAPGTDDQVILPNNSAYAFTGTIVARQQASGGTASAAWKIEGLIRREANAASTTLVASTVTAIDNTPGWTLALSADTTNGGLKIEATGAAATNIRWVATVQTSEVTYA